jgi:hypothetical protein
MREAVYQYTMSRSHVLPCYRSSIGKQWMSRRCRYSVLVVVATAFAYPLEPLLP